ncbi:hypothetical protein BT96DRAFT_691508 [Gymnopus androsaceus JB14]|uniref:Uncharacterized protein n=1 Tax=Gymnopus androsaceus JB14 TaxID=1447944 RepID=A0A6A4HLQ0_9AGAR|nr:hypothetical protein BT96DRAFT_691508 [Gymnopus androsaceus JB14]
MSDSRTHTATSSISSTLATPLASHQPLTVQESRDKRLARQQARFRDRGGIFVSQQRTALLDVLLGKKTLKQVTARRSRSRSASCSPIRRKSGKVVGDEVRPNAGRKSIVQVEDDQDEPVPGPSKVALKKAAPARKGRKKATAVATRTKKSQVEDTVPDATAGSDDFFSKPTTDISNNDTKKVSKARGAARKTKGTSVAARAKGKGKGKGKAKLADVQVEVTD